MSTLKTTNIAHPSSASNNIVLDSSARVGIGTASPAAKFEVSTGASTEARITSTIDNNADLTFYTNGVLRGIIEGNSSGLVLGTTGALPTFFVTNNTERGRFDASGRLLVGTSSTSGNATVHINKGVATGTDGAGVLLSNNGAMAGIGGGEILGYINFGGGTTGFTNFNSASITAQADAFWSNASDAPTRLVFSTTADGASSPTERMRISQAGDVNIGKTAYTSIGTNGHTLEAGGLAHHSVSSNAPLNLNRNVDDGNLVTLYQAGTIEGTISVSGTTVSYNGAHLSRWSQLPSGVERTEILRGSVLSNIDEMCEWGEEDNEQLNRMKVSDVEGDKNVSGVFQSWDDDDDAYTNDFYCAMTGDFIIRIAVGVTIERGDLLMSAGDGTAKPQDDDIIRSKTIAKVTSTNVSCTYEDGSYCVPCVLMAC